MGSRLPAGCRSHVRRYLLGDVTLIKDGEVLDTAFSSLGHELVVGGS